MKRYIYLIAWCLFAVAFLPGYSAHSITVADAKTWSWWGYNGEQNATGTSAGFILDGVLQKYGSKDCNNGPCGTYPGDEGAVVGLIAEKIYENGAQFVHIKCNVITKTKKSIHILTTIIQCAAAIANVPPMIVLHYVNLAILVMVAHNVYPVQQPKIQPIIQQNLTI